MPKIKEIEALRKFVKSKIDKVVITKNQAKNILRGIDDN